MENYRNILLATDFSKNSEWAARRAVDVARRLNAQLTVLHIIDYCPEDIPSDIISSEDLNPGEILVYRAESSLDILAKRCRLKVVKKKVILTSHTARKEIIRYANEYHIDLIVIATHGHHSVTPLLGSTADRVVRGAPCDVLVVRAGKYSDSLKNYSRVLGATDLLDPSYIAARRVTSLVKSYNAKLILLHVVEHLPELPFQEWIGPERMNNFTDVQVRVAKKALQKLSEAIEYPDVDQRVIISTDATAQEIIHFAEAQAIDLIAVGVYGHHSIDFLLGSIAERVLHGALCDVLVARLDAGVEHPRMDLLRFS